MTDRFYDDDDMLMLSGIQHYVFCPRQWALIHLEQEWADNRLTVEGTILHEHVDDPFYRQKCGDYISLRAVHIASHELGLYGITDVVELHPSPSADNAIRHPNYPGYWTPFPVEYKHGQPKPDERDTVQLMAQAICLEEQYGIRIEAAALFYGETNHRETIVLDETLRQMTRRYAHEMHVIYQSQRLPEIIKKPHCRSCSLKDICLPQLSNCRKAHNYLKENLYAQTP